MKKYTKIDGKRFEDICEQCKRNLYDCTCDEDGKAEPMADERETAQWYMSGGIGVDEIKKLLDFLPEKRGCYQYGSLVNFGLLPPAAKEALRRELARIRAEGERYQREVLKRDPNTGETEEEKETRIARAFGMRTPAESREFNAALTGDEPECCNPASATSEANREQEARNPFAEVDDYVRRHGDDNTPPEWLGELFDQSHVMEAALAAFWSSIAESCPFIKTGDLDPAEVEALSRAASKAVAAWIEANTPASDGELEEPAAQLSPAPGTFVRLPERIQQHWGDGADEKNKAIRELDDATANVANAAEEYVSDYDAGAGHTAFKLLRDAIATRRAKQEAFLRAMANQPPQSEPKKLPGELDRPLDTEGFAPRSERH